MTMPGGFELLIILVIALIIFGGGKLAGVGKSLGTAIRDFKDSVNPQSEPEDDEAAKAQGSGSATNTQNSGQTE